MRLAWLVAASALALAAWVSFVPDSSAQPSRVVEPAPLIPRGAKATGVIASSAPITAAVVLKPRDNGALVRFITGATDPGSPSFHHYLPAGAFARRFGPSEATIDAVRSQLRSDGLTVSGVSEDGLLVDFSGTAGRIETAFRTHLESYRLAGGETAHATVSAVQVPAALARSVTTVLGLDDLVPLSSGVIFPKPALRGKFAAAQSAQFPHPASSPVACPEAQTDAQQYGGLTDDQIANAYGAFGLYGTGDTGAGQHIALYELEPFLRSDIRTFDTCYFGAAAAGQMMGRLHVVPVQGGQPAGPGSGEAVLDIEDISALAPGASIDVYEGPAPNVEPSIYDALDEYAAIIDSDRDQIVSTSWGLCEQAVQRGQPGLQEAENYLFEQAAAQGQTVFAAAGDNGSDDCNSFETDGPQSGQNPLSVDDPASQPYAVAAGGTSIDDAASQPALEHVWNDGASNGAGGGGISTSWEMPAWQRDALVPGIDGSRSADYANAAAVERESGYPTGFCQDFVAGATPATPCRLLPDVSAQADEYTGSVTVYSQSFVAAQSPDGWVTSGGTSSAAPTWAAVLALVNASPSCGARSATRRGVGFLSPLLYAVASNARDYAASFNDITSGDTDLYGLRDGLVFPARRGYDLASGLGSPRLTDAGGTAGLAYYLCNAGAPSARPAITRLSRSSGSIAGGERITITGVGFESRGVSEVAGLQVGSRPLPAGRFRVASATTIQATLPPARDSLPPSAPTPQDGAGPAPVIVILKDGAASAPSPAAVFHYVGTDTRRTIPEVVALSPSGGLESARGTVTILGSGFGGAKQVTFGGVSARFRIDSSGAITATRPRYASRMACSPLPKHGVFAHENARNDICQVQVRVSNAAGASARGKILPPLEGALAPNAMGVIEPPPGCRCETAPRPTEFDYLPRPRITGVSTNSGPASLGSEAGGTLITVTGVGLGPLAIEWANVGNPRRDASVDTSYSYLTGTVMQIALPSHALTAGLLTMPLRIRTLAGESSPAQVSYAGLPQVDDIVNTAAQRQLDGMSGAPDTGGSPLEVSGEGFLHQVLMVRFADASNTSLSFGTQYTFSPSSDTSLRTETVQQNPGIVDIRICTVTGCNRETAPSQVVLYPPGAPNVDSVSPGSGPSAGGTETTITGENLGCPLDVFFGTVQATSLTPQKAILDCGSTTTIQAPSPPGTAGSTVPVTVGTLESYFTGSGQGTTDAAFTYGPT
jgi:hypothetical protein